MKAEDALALLEIMRRDRTAPPPIEPQRMARLFARVVGPEDWQVPQTSPTNPPAPDRAIAYRIWIHLPTGERAG